jgi:two-component system chemotaxis response regulator CheB
VPIIEVSAGENVRSDTKAALVNRGDDGESSLARYSIVAIGGSAGGLESVGAILHDLPPDFPSPILVVIHVHPKYISHAAAILCRQTELKVKDAEEQDALRRSIVYIAPPNRHLLVNDGIVNLSDTPAVNFSRPAIDTTFDSVVKAYGSKVIGVILSGTGRDGSEGLRKIKQAGGFAIIEDPVTARFRAMPDAAVSASSADCIVPLKDIAPLLLRLSSLARGSSG